MFIFIFTFDLKYKTVTKFVLIFLFFVCLFFFKVFFRMTGNRYLQFTSVKIVFFFLMWTLTFFFLNQQVNETQVVSNNGKEQGYLAKMYHRSLLL